MTYSRRIMTRVAKLYYEQDKTQTEIARIVDVSRQTVGRILQEAKDNGIVQIRVIDDDREQYKKLGKKITRHFNLRDAYVQPVYDTSPDSIRRALGEAGSRYLTSLLKEEQTLAVTWGRTLLEVVKSLDHSDKIVDIVQTNGSLGQIYSEVNSNELARLLSNKFRGSYYYLPAPGIVDSATNKKSLLKEGAISSSLERARNADIAAVGIGSVDDSLMRDQGLINDENAAKMKEKGVAGDLCLHIIDHDGKPVQTEWEDRIIGITLEDLKKIDCVVGIAGGGKKVDAIFAALKGGYIDILITDSYSAELIIDKL